ncbi:hypothetical protein VIGAN_03297400 [Vigna angularis var. angularis]|uniref:Uncharacterized protein n=1 Tax=Vigna angularis var. angularis TaxID=157739 RepID=A0A0S3RQL8_PHAAN|nr:hypothetical protein VIGAN_03297400 [Vigna angularis var. angularis]
MLSSFTKTNLCPTLLLCQLDNPGWEKLDHPKELSPILYELCSKTSASWQLCSKTATARSIYFGSPTVLWKKLSWQPGHSTRDSG